MTLTLTLTLTGRVDISPLEHLVLEFGCQGSAHGQVPHFNRLWQKTMSGRCLSSDANHFSYLYIYSISALASAANVIVQNVRSNRLLV